MTLRARVTTPARPIDHAARSRAATRRSPRATSREGELMRTEALPIFLLLTSACIWSPNSRIEVEKQNTIAITGYTHQPSSLVKVFARNNNTGALEQLGQTVSAPSEAFTGSGLYYWSTNVSTAAPTLWAPTQLGVGDYSNVAGRLELSATVGGGQLGTFTPDAASCTISEVLGGESYKDAGLHCYDGYHVVHFDNTGLTQGADPNAWHDVQTIANEDLQIDVFTYESQGLDVVGVVCRPPYDENNPPQSPLPVHVINHGGTLGIGEFDVFLCQQFALGGWVAVMSAYRGEPVPGYATPQNNGEVEFCLGEVTDVLRIIDVVDENVVEADMDRVLMSGFSHGGCVTTRAVERGAPVQAAVDLFGPSDWYEWFSTCSGPLCEAFKDQLEDVIGGVPSPGTAPAYRWRSPAYNDSTSGLFAGDLAARTDTKFVIMHGLVDTLVPPKQSCDLATNAWGELGEQWQITTTGASSTNAVGACPKTWNPGPRPTTDWPAQRYLMVYQSGDHNYLVNNTCMALDYYRFIDSLGWAPSLVAELPWAEDWCENGV